MHSNLGKYNANNINEVYGKFNTSNIEKLVNDIDKYFIGDNNWLYKLNCLHDSNTNYPPYNLVKEDSENYRLELALAGYKKEDIEIFTESNKLVVEAKKVNDSEDEYIHQGLAKRAFTRIWSLADDVVVNSVSFTDGLLLIKLNKIIPDHQKKKVYEIVSSVHTNN